MTVLPCRISLSPLDAARVVQLIILEIVMLAVMLGLLDVPSDVPKASKNGPGIVAKRPLAVTIFLPGTVAGLPASRTGP